MWASVSGDRVLTIDPKQPVTPYLIKDLRSGEQRFFDANGLQVLIRLASGHSVRIYRDLHGRIVRVTDPQGRELKLSYPEIASADMKSVLIRQVQHIDTPLGRYSFSYGRDQAPARSANVNGNLVSLAQQHSQVSSLMQLTRPDGSVRHYHYEDPTQGSLLTGISEQASQNAPLVRVVSWSYNSFGRAVRSVKGPIPPEGQRGSEDVSLIFLGAQGQQRRDGSGVTLLTNSEGEQTRYEYEMLGAERQLTLVQGAGCSSCGPANVRYGYDSLGRQVSITNLSPTLVKDGRAQSTAVALSKQELNLDPQGRVLSIVQTRYQGGKEVFRNVVEQREYSDANWPFHPTRIKRPSVLEGREHILEVGYSSAGQIEQIRESGYSPLDNLGNLAASANDASKLERITRLRYEVRGGLTVLTEVDGPLANGPHASPVDSDITRYQWAEDGLRILSITRPMGLSEHYEYEPQQASSAARLIARTDALGVRTELTFQPHSTRLARIGRAGLEVTYGYDLKGRVVSYRRNDGAKISVQYDDDKKEVLYSLPDGEVRKVAFDREGRIKAQAWADAQGKVLVGGVKFEYGQLDSQGLQEIRLTDDSGVVTRTLLNPSQASRSSERGQGEAVFRQTEQFDATQHLLLVQRNEALSQVKDEGPGSPNTALQASRSLTLPHGAQHRQWRDDFGRVVRLQHPETGIHRAAYDEADRQTARWDSSRHSSARYDALGRLIQLRHANTDGASVQTANAVVKAVVSAEEETTWEYGQGNEGALLKRQTSGQQDQHFAYDSHGRLIEERLSIRRQGTSEAQVDGWLPELITRTQRDAFGRIHRIQLPEGAALTQRYNGQGRIEAIALQEPATKWWQSAIRWIWAEHGTRELITGVQHSSSLGLQSYQHANGSLVSSTHDQAGRLIQWRDGPFRTELSFNVHAQLSSLRTEGPERPGPTQVALQSLKSREQSLRYDPFGRLRQVTEGAKSQSFEYDRNGNRIAQTADTMGPMRYTLAAQSDRLLSVQNNQGQESRAYRYNSAGEPVEIDDAGRVGGQMTTRRLHYNAMGQIGAIEEADGHVLVHYAYNGARQRVAKTVAGKREEHATTYFSWHGGLLDAELDGRGRVERRTIYFNLRPVALLEYGYAKGQEAAHPHSAQRFAIHGDHLGTPQAITDEGQRVVWVARYDAFGRANAQGLPRGEVTAQKRPAWMGTAHASSGADGVFEFQLRFAGQYEDSETGWHYNWHRYYEPDTGRYLTPDPIGLQGGDSAFGYAAGDPLGAVDPWGLLVTMTFNTGTGSLAVADQDNWDPSRPAIVVTSPDQFVAGRPNQVLVIQDVFTGENRNQNGQAGPANVPIPTGQYDILDNSNDTNLAHSEWFRLDSIDDNRYDDRNSATGRNGFRLHLGLNSFGCVTVEPTEQNRAMYALMRQMILNTSTETVTNRAGVRGALGLNGSLTRYGALEVR